MVFQRREKTQLWSKGLILVSRLQRINCVLAVVFLSVSLLHGFVCLVLNIPVNSMVMLGDSGRSFHLTTLFPQGKLD